MQEGYHRFEKDKLEQENSELKQQVLDLLAAQRDDRSVCAVLNFSDYAGHWHLSQRGTKTDEHDILTCFDH